MNKPNSRMEWKPDAGARFTVEEFRRMNETGAFDDMKIELVDGELERMNSPQSAHAKWQARVLLRLGSRITEELIVGEVGITIAEDTVLGCDVAVLKTAIASNGWLKPSDIALVVEVSQTTNARDMGMKRLRYAAADIPNYWVVDSDRSVIHVYAEPISSEYATVYTVKFGAPLPVPGTDGSIVID